MNQINLFKDKAEIGDTVYVCGRECTVTKKEHHDPEQNGGEIFYTIHDPAGLGATFVLSERHFTTEPMKEE